MANTNESKLVMEMAIFVNDREEVAIPSNTIVSHFLQLHELPTQFCDRLYKPFFIMYAIWIALIELKFLNETQSPFKTQAFFCNMSLIALCTTLLLFLGLSCIKDFLHNYVMVHKILINVASFMGILAHLSLLFVLLIPPKLNWIGYATICVLLVLMVAYSFSSHIKSLNKTISEMWERIKEVKENNISSQSITSIPV